MMKPLFLLLALAAPATATAQPQFAGAFAVPNVLCDCDPKDFVFRTTRPIQGFEHPDSDGRAIRTVDRGRLIEGNDWSEALTVVTSPGRAVANHDLVLTGLNDYGAARFVDWTEGEMPTIELRIAEGDEIEYLLVDEGYVFFRHAGRLFGGFDPTAEGAFSFLNRPSEAVWFRLVPREGRPAAWIEIRFPRDEAAGNVEVLCNTHSMEEECG